MQNSAFSSQAVGNCNQCQHLFCLPTEGWPGWVGLGGLVNTEMVYWSLAEDGGSLTGMETKYLTVSKLESCMWMRWWYYHGSCGNRVMGLDFWHRWRYSILTIYFILFYFSIVLYLRLRSSCILRTIQMTVLLLFRMDTVVIAGIGTAFMVVLWRSLGRCRWSCGNKTVEEQMSNEWPMCSNSATYLLTGYRSTIRISFRTWMLWDVLAWNRWHGAFLQINTLPCHT